MMSNKFVIIQSLGTAKVLSQSTAKQWKFKAVTKTINPGTAVPATYEREGHGQFEAVHMQLR